MAASVRVSPTWKLGCDVTMLSAPHWLAFAAVAAEVTAAMAAHAARAAAGRSLMVLDTGQESLTDQRDQRGKKQ